MKKFLMGAVAALTLGVSASTSHAADLMDYPVSHNWTGFYAGGNIGYADFDSTWYDVDDDWGNSFNSPFWDGETFSAGSDGITFGGQIGYNMQVQNIVYGIEGSLNYSGTRRTLSSDLNNTGDSPMGTAGIVQNDLNAFATVRGRIGFAMDRILPYATGGLAIGFFDHVWTEFGDPTDSWPDFGDVELGWVAGGGIEYAFSESVSIKGEVLYMDFGSVTSLNQDGLRMRADRSVLTATAGVNFKF